MITIKIILTCLFLQNTSGIKFTDKNDNCFNLQKGRRYISLKKTDCTNHEDLEVDNNKCVIFENSCLKLKTQLFLEKTECSNENTLKYDSSKGFYIQQDETEDYLEQRGRRFFGKFSPDSDDDSKYEKLFETLDGKILQISNATAKKFGEIRSELIQNSEDSASEIEEKMRLEHENYNQVFKNLETKFMNDTTKMKAEISQEYSELSKLLGDMKTEIQEMGNKIAQIPHDIFTKTIFAGPRLLYNVNRGETSQINIVEVEYPMSGNSGWNTLFVKKNCSYFTVTVNQLEKRSNGNEHPYIWPGWTDENTNVLSSYLTNYRMIM